MTYELNRLCRAMYRRSYNEYLKPCDIGHIQRRYLFELLKKNAEKLHMASLEFQSVEGLVEAIGLDRCKLCTYCWTGEE